MKRVLVLLLVLAGLSWLPRSRAAEGAARIDDPGRLLPPDPPATGGLETKLAAFERTTGVRILVEFHLKSPTPAEDKVPGAYMHALATRLGVDLRGVLVVHFADEDDWRVWIGDELAPVFVGHPGTAKELTKSGAIHEAKEVFLTTARATGDAAFAAQQKAARPDRELAAAQRLRFQTDALIDGLIAKLGAK